MSIRAEIKVESAWGRAYNRELAKGYDHGYAAWVADKAQAREDRKAKTRALEGKHEA